MMPARARLGALIAVAASTIAGGAASAASFDCRKASDPIETAICADAELSRADDEMASGYADTLAASLTPRETRQDQRDWLAQRNSARETSVLLAAYRERIAKLNDETAAWRAARADRSTEDAKHDCFTLVTRYSGLRCRVEELDAVKGGHREGLSYQRQSYWDKDGLAGNGIVIVRRTGRGQLAPIIASFDDMGVVWYDPPEFIDAGSSKLLLMPASQGSSHVNESSLFIYRGGRVIEVDDQAWLNDLMPRLPGDLSKGIFPNYRDMTAEAVLANPGDGNCCPSGDTAFIRLGLSGRRIVLKGVSIRPRRPQ